MKRFFLLLFLTLPLATMSLASKAELKPGDAVPAFSMQGSDGQTYSLDNLKGKPFVIAFFPRVFTGG